MTATLLRECARVLTLRGDTAPRRGAAMRELGELTNAGVVFVDGKITWVGSMSALPRDLSVEIEIDCHGRCLMPALVDSHTHVVWGGNRKDELEQRILGADYEEIFARGGGILSSVERTRGADDESLLESSRARVRRMLACGTTSLEIKSGYGLDLATEQRQLRVARQLGAQEGVLVHTTCLSAHALPAEARKSPTGRNDYVRSIIDVILPALAAESLADSCDVFCDRGAFEVEEARAILLRARELGMGLRLHANELGHTGGARLAAELGASSADHLLFVDDDDRRALAEAGVVATLLPGTSLYLRKPYADGRAMIDANVPVAIATDCNPGSCAVESLSFVIGLACHGNRLLPAEAICAATHNAAASLGFADRIGRIEPGLWANLLLLESDDPRDLAYHTGSPLVRQVWTRGVARRAVQEDGPGFPAPHSPRVNRQACGIDANLSLVADVES